MNGDEGGKPFSANAAVTGMAAARQSGPIKRGPRRVDIIDGDQPVLGPVGVAPQPNGRGKGGGAGEISPGGVVEGGFESHAPEPDPDCGCSWAPSRPSWVHKRDHAR
jgi:hypothetical protein